MIIRHNVPIKLKSKGCSSYRNNPLDLIGTISVRIDYFSLKAYRHIFGQQNDNNHNVLIK